jgi:hypothetical protein
MADGDECPISAGHDNSGAAGAAILSSLVRVDGGSQMLGGPGLEAPAIDWRRLVFWTLAIGLSAAVLFVVF